MKPKLLALLQRAFTMPLRAVAAIALAYPLLVIGLAWLTSDIESLSWLDGVLEGAFFLGLGVIALYFLVRAALFTNAQGGKGRFQLALATVSVLHLAGFAAFFTFPFGNQTARNIISEYFEVELGFFVWIFLAIWLLVTLLMVMEYRAGAGRAIRAVSGLGICLLLSLLAAAAIFIVPQVMRIFWIVGLDLPAPTLMVREIALGWIAVPVAGVMLLAVLFLRPHRDEVARSAFLGLVGLLAAANLLFEYCLGALMLPFFTCSLSHDIGQTRLQAAAMLGNTASVARLLREGADVRALDHEAGTALHYAIYGGNASILRTLIAAGADVNAGNRLGHTPLHVAAGTPNRSIEIMELLLEKGARADAASDRGATPLHRAAAANNVTAAALLLASGASVNAEDWDGKTPLDEARSGRNARVAELLVQSGGVASTPESRKARGAQPRAQVARAVPAGSCGAV